MHYDYDGLADRFSLGADILTVCTPEDDGALLDALHASLEPLLSLWATRIHHAPTVAQLLPVVHDLCVQPTHAVVAPPRDLRPLLFKTHQLHASTHPAIQASISRLLPIATYFSYPGTTSHPMPSTWIFDTFSFMHVHDACRTLCALSRDPRVAADWMQHESGAAVLGRVSSLLSAHESDAIVVRCVLELWMNLAASGVPLDMDLPFLSMYLAPEIQVEVEVEVEAGSEVEVGIATVAMGALMNLVAHADSGALFTPEDVDAYVCPPLMSVLEGCTSGVRLEYACGAVRNLMACSGAVREVLMAHDVRRHLLRVLDMVVCAKEQDSGVREAIVSHLCAALSVCPPNIEEEEEKATERLWKVVMEFDGCSGVLSHALDALLHQFTSTSLPINATPKQTEEWIRILMDVSNQHYADARVHVPLFGLLTTLLLLPPHHDKVAPQSEAVGADDEWPPKPLHVVLMCGDVLVVHGDDARLQRACLGSLLALSAHPRCRHHIVEEGLVKSLRGAMEAHRDDPYVQQLALGVLQNVALDDRYAEALMRLDVVEDVALALERHMDYEFVVAAGCGLLGNLMLTGDDGTVPQNVWRCVYGARLVPWLQRVVDKYGELMDDDLPKLLLHFLSPVTVEHKEEEKIQQQERKPLANVDLNQMNHPRSPQSMKKAKSHHHHNTNTNTGGDKVIHDDVHAVLSTKRVSFAKRGAVHVYPTES
jgi:hypothetical protein